MYGGGGGEEVGEGGGEVEILNFSVVNYSYIHRWEKEIRLLCYGISS